MFLVHFKKPHRDGGMKTDEMQTNKESQVLVSATALLGHHCQYQRILIGICRSDPLCFYEWKVQFGI